MKLNRIQKKVLLIGFALLLAVTIFLTPWGRISDRGFFHQGHSPIFLSPKSGSVINYARMGMYWILVAIGTGVFIIYFKDEDK